MTNLTIKSQTEIRQTETETFRTVERRQTEPESQQTKTDGSLLQLGVRLIRRSPPSLLGPRPLPAKLLFHLKGGPLRAARGGGDGGGGGGLGGGGAGVAAGHEFQTHQLTVMKYV